MSPAETGPGPAGRGAAEWRGVISCYAEYLPIGPGDPVITLCEGNTPLLRCDRLAQAIGAPIELYVKWEGQNPTGSFKDRGMTVAISKAVAEGSRAVICASTGNTSASAAAYAARAGLRAFVVVPRGNIALGKLTQAIMHGATVIEVDGNFDQALALVREAAARFPITLVNSVNPYRLEGQKTASFEVCDWLGGVPSAHFLPVGNAGNITAYWRGYREYRRVGRIASLPRMMGFEAEGAAPIARGAPVPRPTTVASAIRIGNPASWQGAVAARDESGGVIETVGDEEIMSAYRLLATMGGIFAEPASAVSIAGLRKVAARGELRRGDVVVCTLTGHGLKDPETAMRFAPTLVRIRPEIDELSRHLELGA